MLDTASMTDAITIAIGVTIGGCITVAFHRWYDDWRSERWHRAREASIAKSSRPCPASGD